MGTSEGVVQHVHLFCTCYPPGGWHCMKLHFHWIPAALYPLSIAWTCLFETQIRQMNVETKCNTEYASGVNHILLLHVRGLLSCTGNWFGVGILLWDWVELLSMTCLLSAHGCTNQYCNHLYLKASQTIRQGHLEIPPPSAL